MLKHRFDLQAVPQERNARQEYVALQTLQENAGALYKSTPGPLPSMFFLIRQFVITVIRFI